MPRQTIESPEAPAAIGPYVQAVQAGDFVFCSGQVPLDPESGQVVAGGIAEQSHQVFRNMAAVLKAAGCGPAQILKNTLYIKNMDDFATINEIYSQYYGEHPPARACVEVSRLPKDVMIEMDTVASKAD